MLICLHILPQHGRAQARPRFSHKYQGIFQRKSIYYTFLLVNLLLNTVSLNWHTNTAKSLKHYGPLYTIKSTAVPQWTHLQCATALILVFPLSLFFFLPLVHQEDLSQSYEGESVISYSFRGLGTSLLLSHLFSKTHRTAAVLTPPAYLLNPPPSTGNQRIWATPGLLRCTGRPLPVLWFFGYVQLYAPTASSCYSAPNYSILWHTS